MSNDDDVSGSEGSDGGLSAFTRTGAPGVVPPRGFLRGVARGEPLPVSVADPAAEVAELLAATHLGRVRAAAAARRRVEARGQLPEGNLVPGADLVFMAAEQLGVRPDVVERAKQRLQALVKAPF